MKTVKTIWMFAFVVAAMLLASQRVPAALIHAYNMDEGAGTTLNDLVGTENGTFGSAKSGADWVAGHTGTGVRFNGPLAFDYVDFGSDSSFDLTTSGTVMAWVNQNTDAEARLWQKGWAPSGDDFSYMFVYGGNLDNEWDGSGNPTLRLLAARGNGFPLNTWTHLAVTWDQTANAAAMYVNGVLVDSDTFPNVLTTVAGEFIIGADVIHAGRTLNGIMDDLRIFDTTLSQSQIVSFMNTSLSVPEPGTLLLLGLGGLVLWRWKVRK